MKSDRRKIIEWFLKLAILTAAIYWFMTKGLTISIGESVGLSTAQSASSTAQNEPNTAAFIYAAIVIAFLVFAVVRSIYERRVTKPKSSGYKKYREMR